MTYSSPIPGACRLLAAAFCVSVLAFSGSSQAADTAEPPAAARPMTGYELYRLYGNNSWLWSDGAGLMETRGRRFTAYAGSGGERSLAEGRWIVTDSGRLCLEANWRALSGIYPDRTCFAHLVHDNTIYQRKEPGGDWYVFKHAEPAAGDEFNQLVRRDLVSGQLQDTRSGTGSHEHSPTSTPPLGE